ncbi:MAG: VC0807 family protein [Trebonia sp.]
MTTTTAPPPAPPGIRPAALAGVLLGGLIAPACVYYAARALGAPVMLAVLLGGLACLPRQAVELARRRRLDGLGAAVLIVLAVSGLLSLLSGDARVLVVKDAGWPLAAGAVTAVSCLRGKPVTFFVLRPMLTQGQPENRPFWDQVWAAGGAFRHSLRVLAAGWSVILLAAGAVELLLALYGKHTGLGVRRSLATMDLTGDAR